MALTAHETTTAVLHEYTLVLVARCGRHLDDNVDKRGRLRHLPVQTSGTIGRRYSSEIDDKVSD